MHRYALKFGHLTSRPAAGGTRTVRYIQATLTGPAALWERVLVADARISPLTGRLEQNLD
jgi:hypothetical protein